MENKSHVPNHQPDIKAFVGWPTYSLAINDTCDLDKPTYLSWPHKSWDELNWISGYLGHCTQHGHHPLVLDVGYITWLYYYMVYYMAILHGYTITWSIIWLYYNSLDFLYCSHHLTSKCHAPQDFHGFSIRAVRSRFSDSARQMVFFSSTVGRLVVSGRFWGAIPHHVNWPSKLLCK